MKRIAIIGIILGVLLIADGIYMVAIKYNSGETQAWNLPDGWIIIISAVILLVASILAYVLPARSRVSTEPVTASGRVDAEPVAASGRVNAEPVTTSEKETTVTPAEVETEQG